MKKLFLLLACFLLSIAGAYAYVVICPADGQTGVRSGCLRITEVNINGEWVEADCENVDAPQGWFKYDCP